MPIEWPRPKMASVDDIPSWEHAAPTLAASFGRLQEQKWLKAWQGGDLDAKDEAGWSALQRAAAEGLAVAAKELLRRPGVDANGVEPTKGQPALVLASRGGHEAVVRVLLACTGVEVNHQVNGDYTALHIAAQNGHAAVVERLLAHAGVDADRADQMGRTPLWMAAMANHEATVRLLIAHPAVDAERANQWGITPLLQACRTRSTAAALALLEAKADPNARANNGDAPLVIARRGDNAQLLAALVAAGADVTALYPPLVAKCMLGDAHAARTLLLESASAARAFQVLGIDEGLAGDFRRFDADRSGDIDAAELQQVLLGQGMEVDAAQAQQVLAKFDRDGTGKLDLHAFWRFTQAPGWAQRTPALRLEALLSDAPAPEPTDAAGEAASLPAHVKGLLACLRGDAASLAALDGSDACEASADGLPPAFCFAVELGDAAVVEAVLAGAKGLDGPQRAVLCAQAARAARTHDAAASSGYVPGAAAASSTPHLGQG